MTKLIFSIAAFVIAAFSATAFAQLDQPTTSGWQTPRPADVEIQDTGPMSWKVTARKSGEFTVESRQSLPCRPGETFSICLNIRVDINTKALPELVCFDASGKEIPSASVLEYGPRYITTNWQEVRRVFASRPGTTQVRARVRGSGKGSVELSDLDFHLEPIDTYQTGALVTQLHPSLRNGVVLESNFGIVNAAAITNDDRDGDGKWALIPVDLDRLTEPSKKGVDWRSNFEGNPNEILWSDGAVLKSDSIREDRAPDRERALHFQSHGRRGPYQAWMNDPGRSIAWSRDGKTWHRHEAGQEIDLGIFPREDGLIEFWIDACYRDPISPGPAYFDYVRLYPVEDPAAVERLFEAARWKAQPLARGSVPRREVNVTVRAPQFTSAKSWPVRCALPIPEGELADSEHMSVMTAAGAAIPSQSRVLATWPDRSVKWLFVEFSHDLRGAADASYTVAYGNQVAPSGARTGVQLRETDAGIAIDTGAIRFVVPRKLFGLIENVRLASGEQLQQGPIETQIVEQGGKIWKAHELPVAKLAIEQAGPLHAVVLVETPLAESGQPASGFAYRARVHAYANSPLIEIDYFVANTDSRLGATVEGSMSSKVPVQSISLKIKPEHPITSAIHSLGTCDAPGAIIQAAEDKVILNSKSGSRQTPGRVAGWASFEQIGNRTLSVGVPAFREQYPKAFRWSPNGLEIDLWAAEGGIFDWIEGVGKTHHVALYYGADKPVSAELLSRTPLLAIADPRWYAVSGAMGPLSPAAASPLPAVEKTLARHLSESVIERVGLGFENYGDHSSSGYVQGSPLWDNNEYDLPAGCLVHFARTGDRQALELGLAAALHYLDVDTVHYSSQHADWAHAQHVHSHGTFGHHTAQGPDMHHAGYVQGLLWYSYFMGDPAGIEGAKGIADWILGASKIHVTGMERALGHPLTTLNDIYEATGDEKYLRGAARLVQQAIQWEHPQRSGFLAPITESPAYYSGSPFCGGLVPSALQKFNSWAKQPEIDAMLERVARWTLTDMWRPPGNIYTKGGSPRRGGDGQQIASYLRTMDYVFAKTGDPLFLVVPREAVARGFGENAKPIGTRSTGLVFNNVPWFLTTLQNYGDPQPDLKMKVAGPNEISLARGAKTPIVIEVTNTGDQAIAGFRASLQARLDITTRELSPLPTALAPAETVKLLYEIEAPEHVNVQCLCDRLAYVHFTSLYQRGNQPQFVHAPITVSLHD
jgi:hypothetical protein